jgi:hypothetical protein
MRASAIEPVCPSLRFGQSQQRFADNVTIGSARKHVFENRLCAGRFTESAKSAARVTRRRRNRFLPRRRRRVISGEERVVREPLLAKELPVRKARNAGNAPGIVALHIDAHQDRDGASLARSGNGTKRLADAIADWAQKRPAGFATKS